MTSLIFDEYRRAAEAVLAGQVNDWVEAARENARNVVCLCDEYEPEIARLGAALAAFEHTATNLNARIVETSDSNFHLAYPARGVVQAFRKLLTQAKKGTTE